jgi:hypothetical protein
VLYDNECDHQNYHQSHPVKRRTMFFFILIAALAIAGIAYSLHAVLFSRPERVRKNYGQPVR